MDSKNSYKIGVTLLVMPVLVFFYLIGISAFNQNAVSVAADDYEEVAVSSCGTREYEKTIDFYDDSVYINFEASDKKITVSGKNGWTVSEVWLDVSGDGQGGYSQHVSGPLSSYDPSGDEINEVKVELYKACPSVTPTRTITPTPTRTSTPTPTRTATPTPTNTPVPTATVTPSPTNTPVPTATVTPSPTNTPVPTATVTPSPTNTPVPTITVTPTASIAPTATVEPTGRVLGTETKNTTKTEGNVLAASGRSLYTPLGIGIFLLGAAVVVNTNFVFLKKK